MVKRSKKSKSKRVSLKQKYKVIRKVKEHHKKKAKEAKKLGLNRKKKVEKDPGIPNDWPFKEQELKALEARRARALEELEQKKAARKERIKKSITVGVIGLPNVGKSSLINSLKRCHVVNVGATPGLTRSMQEVQLDKNVKLLDCPGVVMLRSEGNDASIALRNCKRIEKLDDPVGPVKDILKLCPERLLVTIYKIPGFQSVDEFLQNIATVRGKLKKGGIVDVEAAARIILHDWNEGKIPYYTMPPVRNQEEPSEARIVTELGKEFNVDEVYNTESSFIGSLKSTDDFHSVEVPASHPLKFDEAMLEQLREFQRLKEPVQLTSLPPLSPSSKGEIKNPVFLLYNQQKHDSLCRYRIFVKSLCHICMKSGQLNSAPLKDAAEMHRLKSMIVPKPGTVVITTRKNLPNCSKVRHQSLSS
ncbi:hypothetical protein GOBAR_DD08998 [Gossypium barbadense]|nr:hypothetical protein GOBAR_DD08998 [Gossypium barbadense]